MGAVQRLATVVIVGLVALATLIVVYLAVDPNLRAEETTEQQLVAIERGTDLYITYCLQCHGPAGLGALAQEENPRIGAPLNQSTLTPEQLENARAIYQSDDPVEQGIAEDWIRFRIMYGAPADPVVQNKVMPAFGNDLNVEEINALVHLIMNADWNYVYNTAVLQTGVAVAEEQCAKDPEGEHCDDIAHAPPAYPTPPPPPPAEEALEDQGMEEVDGGEGGGEPAEDGDVAAEAGAVTDEGTDLAAQGGGEAITGEQPDPDGPAVTLEALDPAVFSENAITVAPGDTIEMTNAGFLQHDFTVDELGIHEVTPSNGDTVTITIPEDAEPGEYEFYCSVPGHRDAGMFGTLTVEAP